MLKKGYRKSCDRDGECVKGYVCKGLDGCRYQDGSRKYNEKCAFNTECASGKCNIKDGDDFKCSCINDHDCGSGKACINWKCKPKVFIGRGCERNTQCKT